LPYGQTEVKIITLIALAMMMVFGPVAAATVWSSGSYGLEAGSVTWPTKDVSVQGVTKLGGASRQASLEDQTASAMGLGNNSIQVISQGDGALFHLGNNSSQVASQEETATMVQLGIGGGSVSAQAPASGTVQLSGYYNNMGSYMNIFYPINMLGGTFSSSGGGGCGCCG